MTQDLARQTTFANRTEAGRALVEPLREYTNRPDAIVLALPRGGVPVAYEVATALGLRLDLLVVRKLGLPSHPEYAMGAIASGASAFSMTMRSERIPSTAPVSKLCWTRKPRNCCDGKEIPGQSPTAAAQGPSGNPYRRRPGHRRLDDGRRSSGAGTGAFAHRGCGAGLAPDTLDALCTKVDQVICPLVPERMVSVGYWYLDFPQTTDEEVRRSCTRQACVSQRETAGRRVSPASCSKVRSSTSSPDG